jgi:hypothetical protein
MDGFCAHNFSNNLPALTHDKVGLVGCRLGVTAQVDSE